MGVAGKDLIFPASPDLFFVQESGVRMSIGNGEEIILNRKAA